MRRRGRGSGEKKKNMEITLLLIENVHESWIWGPYTAFAFHMW